MSLINDALKRAKQAQQDDPSPLPPGPPLRPADPEQRRSVAPGMLLVVVLIIVVSLGGFFVWWVMQERNATQQTANMTAMAAPATPVPPVPVTPQTSAPQPSPAAVATPAAPPAAETASVEFASANAASNAPTVEPEALLKPPPPRLQGILYRPGRASAVIDGKAVFVGDSVGEFRVSAITRQNVTLVSASQTNVLNLSE